MSDPNITRETISHDMSQIATEEHALHSAGLITITTLNNAIIGMSKFFLEETDPSEKIPYQYQKKNQSEFEKYHVIISACTDKIEPVISDMNEKSFRLEKNQQQAIIQSAPQMPFPTTMNMPQPEQKEKKGFSNPFAGKPKKPPLNPDDPYQSLLKIRKQIYRMLEMWDLVVEWQAEGVEFDEDFDRIAFDNYLSNHRVIFRHEVEPNLLRIYSQGVRLILMKEKEMATLIATSMQKESFQTRQDMPMPPR